MELLAASRLQAVGQRVLPLREREAVELHQRSVVTSRLRVAMAPQPLEVKWQREVVLSAASWPRVVNQPTRSTIAYLPTERSPTSTPQWTTKKYSPLPPEIVERLLMRTLDTSFTVWRWEQEGLPHPPAAPGCGRDGLPHLLGQRKAFQSEWRGRVGSYR